MQLNANAAELAETFLATFNDNFPDTVLTHEVQYDMPIFTVVTEKIDNILRYLRDKEEFQILTTVCGLHHPEQVGQELGVMYQLHSLTRNIRLRFKVFVPVTKPEVPSVCLIYDSANWQERETFDFYGVVFTNHPNLQRILNMDEMTYHPLRKEYPLEDLARSDKNDAFFGR